MNFHWSHYFTLILVCAVLSANAFSVDNDAAAKLREIRNVKSYSKDPAKFVKEVKSELDKWFESDENVWDQYATLDEDDANEAKLIDEITKIGKELKNVASIAHSFNIDQIEDVRVRSAVKQLQHIGGIYRMGLDSIPLVKNKVALRDNYGEDYMESVDDSDTFYSLKNVDDYLLRTGEVTELKRYWKYTYDNSRIDQENAFDHVIELIQRNAEDFNSSAAEFWYPYYYAQDIKMQLTKISAIMDQFKPFYQRMHAVVRRNLMKKFGAGIIKPNGPIPEHIFKKVWAEAWVEDSIFESEFPQKNFPIDDILSDIDDSKKILEFAENFYESLGFENFTENFWNDSIISDSDAIYYCPGEVDFSGAKLTLKYCSSTDFITYREFHVLIGKAHSILLPRELSKYLVQGHFVDAVGKTVELAASTPKHLNKIGLFSDLDATDMLLNYNFRSALQFLFSLPYAYASVRVMTKILNDEIKKDELNSFYWRIMEEYGGIEPPIHRTEDSLDLPFSFYKDLNDNTDVVGKFYDQILAYRLYRAICQNIGHVGVLHNCDFSGSPEVGTFFREILTTGTSEQFADILKLETLDDASAILDYFEPTINWLKKANVSKVGWEHTTKQFTEKTVASDDDLNAFIAESSEKIFSLYDQISENFFTNKPEAEEFEDEDGENMFWKISNSATAVAELKEISLKAKQIELNEIKNKTAQKAIIKLGQLADVSVLEDDLESFLSYKALLNNLSIDRDVPKFKATTDEELVAYYPDIENIFLNSSNLKELNHYWVEWRFRNDAFARALLLQIVGSIKKAADLLEISVTDFWFKHFSTDFIDEMESVIKSLKPIYAKLHLYIRQLLVRKYGYDDFSRFSGAIPDHLIEQVLLQIWTNASIIEKDFPLAALPATEQALSEKGWDAVKLLHNADEFFHSLGFANMNADFWTSRVKPQIGAEKHGDCHATIYDTTPKVYMQYCEKVNYRKLLQAYSYFGRLHYAVEKSKLPAYYFDSYFLEYPVGEAVLLSATSPSYLQFIGLATVEQFSEAVRLNRLMRMSIHTLFNIHKYFVNTKLISELLEGYLDEEDITKRYWELMIKYAGIEPPCDRKSSDFDFPPKFYTDLEHNHQMKKFFSDVLGYQVYEALCKLKGHEGELNTCDLYGSTVAGDALKEMMLLGSSKPWKTVLKVVLGKRNELSANALLNYYGPVENWLEKKVDLDDIGKYSVSSYKYWRSEDIISSD